MKKAPIAHNNILTVEHFGKKYTVSEDTPKDGDMVLTERYGVWKFKQAPCPMPFWGNPDTCKKLIPIN